MHIKSCQILLTVAILIQTVSMTAATDTSDVSQSLISPQLHPTEIVKSSQNETGWFESVRHFLFGNNDSTETSSVGESRTFGRIKKLQAALLPIMFKLGALSTLMGVLVFLTAKSVFIGIILLIMNLVGIAVKLVLWKTGQHHEHYEHHNSWQPQWQAPPQQKEIHLHIHNAPAAPVAEKHYEPYGSYSSSNHVYAEPSVSSHSVHQYPPPSMRRDALVTELSNNLSPYVNANALGNLNANTIGNYHVSAFRRR